MGQHETPQAVRDAFAARFPGAAPASWDHDGDTYETELMHEGRGYAAQFAADGAIVRIESEVDPEELPDEVLEALEAAYPGCEVEEAECVELADGAVRFALELTMAVHVTFDGEISPAEDDR